MGVQRELPRLPCKSQILDADGHRTRRSKPRQNLGVAVGNHMSRTLLSELCKTTQEEIVKVAEFGCQPGRTNNLEDPWTSKWIECGAIFVTTKLGWR